MAQDLSQISYNNDSLQWKRLQKTLTGGYRAIILFTSSKYPNHVLAYALITSYLTYNSEEIKDQSTSSTNAMQWMI